MKSQRSKISPPLADKHNVALEHSRISKDHTRDNFLSLVDNLPQINRKLIKNPGPPVSNPKRRTHRKAGIPDEARSRITQSLGPTAGLNTEASTLLGGADMLKSADQSTHKVKSNSQYPDYFFKPKENLFEGRRGSRYDTSKPRTFKLTQPDTNLARFVFNSAADPKKRGLET